MDKSYDFVRLLYFKDLDDLGIVKINAPENVAIYHVGCVLFALSSSMFLLSDSLIYHTYNYVSFDPEFTLHSIKSLHVHDLISDTDSLQKIERFQLTCNERLAAASFNLQKFISTSGN